MDKIRIWDYEAIARGAPGSGVVPLVPDTDARPGESPSEWDLRMLLKHLQALAADPATVLRAYPADCDVTEILADDFNEYLGRSERAVRESLVPPDYLEPAGFVGKQLSEMDDRADPDLWTNEALRRRPEWAALRRLAADALEAMGYDLEPPPCGSM